MKGLTREEAIRRHRDMWSWIASETLRLKRAVSKPEARLYFDWPRLVSGCWLCEYNGEICDPGSDGEDCLIQWPGGRCCYGGERGGLYAQWIDAYYKDDYLLAAEFAQRIAMLPEKEESNNAT